MEKILLSNRLKFEYVVVPDIPIEKLSCAQNDPMDYNEFRYFKKGFSRPT